MRPGVDLFQSIDTDVGIDLCCGEAFMTEHFLDCPQIRPSVEQMRGKRMTKDMRALLLDLGNLSYILIHKEIHTFGIQGVPSLCKKHRAGPCRILPPLKEQPSHCKVQIEGTQRFATKGNNPFLFSLSENLQRSPLEIDIMQS